MTSPFVHYIKIKNRYCIAYFGHTEEYIEQLKKARPVIEDTYPGVEIHLCCRDSLFHLLASEPNCVKESELRPRRREYNYVRTITYDMVNNPVAALLAESNISPSKIGL